MLDRFLWSVAVAFICSAPIQAQVSIKVQDQKGNPVANASVLIEPISKDGSIIAKGNTDAKGVYASGQLPAAPSVSITIYPSPKSGLDSKTKDYILPQKQVIIITLKKKQR
jgi:hypothetical protein